MAARKKKRAAKRKRPAKESPPPAARFPTASRARARAPRVSAKARKYGHSDSAPAKRPPGRPTKRNKDLEDRLLDWLATGGTLRAFCRLEGSPSHVTVHSWRAADKSFSERYQKAREIGWDELAEECLEIADTTEIGETEEEGETGGENGGPWSKVKREDMLGHRKLKVWTRLQLLAKWFPKKYGTKLDVEHATSASFDDLLRKTLGIDHPAGESGK